MSRERTGWPLHEWYHILGLCTNSSPVHAACLAVDGWDPSCGYSQIGLGEWKSILPSPCISIPAPMSSLLTSPLGKDRAAR